MANNRQVSLVLLVVAAFLAMALAVGPLADIVGTHSVKKVQIGADDSDGSTSDCMSYDAANSRLYVDDNCDDSVDTNDIYVIGTATFDLECAPGSRLFTTIYIDDAGGAGQVVKCFAPGSDAGMGNGELIYVAPGGATFASSVDLDFEDSTNTLTIGSGPSLALAAGVSNGSITCASCSKLSINSAGGIQINAVGTIELLDPTEITGTLDVSSNAQVDGNIGQGTSPETFLLTTIANTRTEMQVPYPLGVKVGSDLEFLVNDDAIFLGNAADDTMISSIFGAFNSTQGGTYTGPVLHYITLPKTAFAGGGQGSATVLDCDTCQIGTVATDEDSVKLEDCGNSGPLGLGATGRRVWVTNQDASEYAAMFPASGDDLGNGTNVEKMIGPGGTVTCVCTTADLLYCVDMTGLAHAGISAIGNATATTISTSGVAVQITIFDTDDTSYIDQADHTNDHITITEDGDYLILATATINSVSGAGSRMEMTVQKNNGATNIRPLYVDRNISGGGGQAGSVATQGIAVLTAGDTIEVWIENETNTANYVVENIALTVQRVR